MSGDMEKWDGLAKVLGLQPGESLMDAAQRVLAQLGHALAKSSGRVNEQRARAEKAEKERDEAIDKAIDYMAACTKAETERDAATGALAAAVAALNRWRSFAGDNILDCDGHLICAAEDSCPQEPACDESCLELRRALDATEPFIFKSPAADLAARHDAEVERRALEKAAVRLRAVLGAEQAACVVLELATPTPEKSR